MTEFLFFCLGLCLGLSIHGFLAGIQLQPPRRKMELYDAEEFSFTYLNEARKPHGRD